MAKGKQSVKGRGLVIFLPDEGDPTFEFTGQWSTKLLERIHFKAQKALRAQKVRMAQQMEHAGETANDIQDKEE